MEYRTVFGSLDQYEKGGIEIIDDDPKHYAFSNAFEVASTSKPYEKVAVAINQQYVVEVIRAEGESGWRTCDHDETVLCLDGAVTVEFMTLETPIAEAGSEGSVAVPGTPSGVSMGRVELSKGHMALLPRQRAYRFRSAAPAVLLQQTCLGPDTVQRWAEICLS